MKMIQATIAVAFNDLTSSGQFRQVVCESP